MRLSPPLKPGSSLPSSAETEAENDFHLPVPQSQREKSKALGGTCPGREWILEHRELSEGHGWGHRGAKDAELWPLIS